MSPQDKRPCLHRDIATSRAMGCPACPLDHCQTWHRGIRLLQAWHLEYMGQGMQSGALPPPPVHPGQEQDGQPSTFRHPRHLMHSLLAWQACAWGRLTAAWAALGVIASMQTSDSLARMLVGVAHRLAARASGVEDSGQSREGARASGPQMELAGCSSRQRAGARWRAGQ